MRGRDRRERADCDEPACRFFFLFLLVVAGVGLRLTWRPAVAGARRFFLGFDDEDDEEYEKDDEDEGEVYRGKIVTEGC